MTAFSKALKNEKKKKMKKKGDLCFLMKKYFSLLKTARRFDLFAIISQCHCYVFYFQPLKIKRLVRLCCTNFFYFIIRN